MRTKVLNRLVDRCLDQNRRGVREQFRTEAEKIHNDFAPVLAEYVGRVEKLSSTIGGNGEFTEEVLGIKIFRPSKRGLHLSRFAQPKRPARSADRSWAPCKEAMVNVINKLLEEQGWLVCSQILEKLAAKMTVRQDVERLCVYQSLPSAFVGLRASGKKKVEGCSRRQIAYVLAKGHEVVALKLPKRQPAVKK